MADTGDLEAQVQQAELAVTKQGDIVRSLKALLKEGKGEKVKTKTFNGNLGHASHARSL